ncbi:MAG: DegT/DnrJ/EryC1/StrS family aminotransferase [bacterium]
MIPFENLEKVNRPNEPALRAAFEEVLCSGRYVLGEQVEAFEEALAAVTGVPHAVGTGSGYDAITIALRALGLREGEAIVPANTCPATVLAVRRSGLVPVLVDPDPATLLLSPEGFERRHTCRTVAVVPVHQYGLPCDMDAILSIASRRGIAVIEDCAQAQGAEFRGRPVGSFGHAAAFSFYPTKNLGGLGDGGAVLTASSSVAEEARKLRNYGYGKDGQPEAVGLNSRLDALQAAFLRAKLPLLPGLVARKNALAARYDRELSPVFRRPVKSPGAEPARHLYPILHPRRDDLRRFLRDRGIETAIHYPVSPERLAASAGAQGLPCPVAAECADTIMSLPLSAGLTDDEVRTVVHSVNRYAEIRGPACTSP